VSLDEAEEPVLKPSLFSGEAATSGLSFFIVGSGSLGIGVASRQM